MTTIFDLPEEILYTIFNEFDHKNLKNFQHVCRAWYIPAHIKLLNKLELSGACAIQLFIKSIDHNPDPAYLKAVKSINFEGFTAEDPFQLDNELNQKLFCRFPNLKKVRLSTSSSLKNFDDEMCKTFLVKCPKVKAFFVKSRLPQPGYRDFIYKAKLLITGVDLNKLEDVPNITQFLSSFPRLQTLVGPDNSFLQNFKQLLKILPHTPLLRSIALGPANDAENIAEKYLRSKSKDEQIKLVKHLSKIHGLWISTFCANSISFANKYLTRLGNLWVYSDESQNWGAKHTKVLCNLIAEIPRIKFSCLKVDFMNIDAFSTCFPIAAQKLFLMATNYKKPRCLSLTVGSTNNFCITGSNSSSSDSSSSLVALVRLDDQLSLPEISQRFFTPAYNNVDSFCLYIGSYDNQKTSLDSYNMILRQMPSLKAVTLEITEDFIDEEGDGESSKLELPLVEELTILATVDASFQTLLDTYYYALSDLKNLTFCYAAGIWQDGVFRVELPSYSLKTLSLDVTPVEKKSHEILCNYEDEFFVLEVKLSSTNEQHRYRISLDLSSVSRLYDGDLDGLIFCDDYFKVNVTINSLQNLMLFVHVHSQDCCKYNDKRYYTPCTDTLPHVMILKNDEWK